MKKWIEKRPEIRKFKKVEASWLAGVIDGEGSIGLYDYGREGRRVCIQMSNTSEDYVNEMRKIIGCGSQINRTNWHKSHKGRKQLYLYSLKGSNRCFWVLKQIIPYLIIKKVKALDIIRELESKPFGRWANCTKEYRRLNSERLKREWQDPIIRKNRISGMKKYHES
ncbi:MAG: hypothetical protein AAB857_03705 [Patescibacteria group bacterium]